MNEQAGRYIPALNRRWLTPAYDWAVAHLFPEREFKSALIEEARLTGKERVLDIGCGTGTLTIALAEACPAGAVVGLDGDPAILERARAKAAIRGLHISFDEGMSYALPYGDGAFDRVASSLMLHHLARGDKERTLREAFRVLRAGGRLHIADFGPPEGAYARAISRVTIHFEETKENLRGELPAMVRGIGFEDVRPTRRFGTLFGTLQLLHASKR